MVLTYLASFQSRLQQHEDLIALSYARERLHTTRRFSNIQNRAHHWTSDDSSALFLLGLPTYCAAPHQAWCLNRLTRPENGVVGMRLSCWMDPSAGFSDASVGLLGHRVRSNCIAVGVTNDSCLSPKPVGMKYESRGKRQSLY